ncbi:GmrSD restriction endonuclease domain-containing protein [Nodosilinea sp. AN01ver1]
MPLRDLLSQMAQGYLQMPRFQREFVWPVSKTRALLDSMFKEFPIGTLFFWQAPSDHSDIFRELRDLKIPPPQVNQSISFILDGQQRLTSLFAAGNALKIGSRDYGNICIDLECALEYESSHDEGFEKEIFVSRRVPDNVRYVSFYDVMASNLQVYDGLSSSAKSIFQVANSRFTNYPFSVVWVRDQPLAEVVEIFQRINQGGKRLSSYDLVCANLWTENFNFRNKVSLVNSQLVENGFEEVDEQIIPQSISLILRGSATQSVQLRLRTEEVEEIWERLVQSISRSVDFVRTNMGVKRASFLPYRGILPVLTYYFYNLDGTALSADHRKTLWKWFWSVALSERYSANSQARIAEDVSKLRELLDGKSVSFDYASKASSDVLSRVSVKSTTSALRNTVLCMLALRVPRNFKDGSQVNISDNFFDTLARAERHRIFSPTVIRKQGLDPNLVHSICNFAFIPSELNREISGRKPSEYFSQYQAENSEFKRDLKSHVISPDESSSIWSDDFSSFIRERSELIADSLKQLLDEDPFDDEQDSFEGYEHDIVKSIEIQIRDLIDERLTAFFGENYWHSSAPQNIANKVNNKIGQHIMEHPYLNPADYALGRKKLDFCDVSDYKAIMTRNWSQFEEIFGKQDTLISHFDNFRTYRNLVAHSNHSEINDVQKLSAKAAISWFQQSIDSFYMRNQQQEIDSEP